MNVHHTEPEVDVEVDLRMTVDEWHQRYLTRRYVLRTRNAYMY